MEQLIAGTKFPAKCVKNEIHNLLTTLRLTRSKTMHGPQAAFHSNSLRSFQRLFEELTYIHELHEFDTVAYLGPFLEVIQSDATDGQITAVALGAVGKFVSFGLIHPDTPRCMEAVNTVAWGVINCRFISSGSSNDEGVLLKMVGVLIDCLRCPAGEYLSDACVWNMVRKCFQISRMPHASHLLRSSAEGVLQQMVLTIFGTQKTRSHRVRVKTATAATAVPSSSSTSPPHTESAGPTAAPTTGSDRQLIQVYRPYGYRAMHFVLRFLAFLLAYGRTAPAAAEAKPRVAKPRRPRSRSPSCDRSPPRSHGPSRDNSPSGDDDASSDLGLIQGSAGDREDLCTATHCLGLSLLNVALESGGDEIARSDELICVIQDDICKSLLQNSRTDSLSVLSLTLRSIFNIFLHFKRHLKVQLEIFFTSVHLKIAGLDAAYYEHREIALESLLEFCREPELMLELYENYDCDVRCTNLFETLVKFLITNAFPPSDGANGARASFSPLHRLALSGLLSILHSIALRCEGRFRGEDTSTGPPPMDRASSAETELQRKKEQKRRLTLATRAFNGDPSKSMAALQGLGLVSSPPTPESMAEFLRHTPGLDLRIVGEYLSKRKDFNGQVRKAFMDLFPFTGLGLTEALRMLLSTFRLPGEAQLIERLMESFAEAYFVKQPPVLEGGGAEGGAEGGKPQDPMKTCRWVPREKHMDEGGEGPGNGASPGSGGGPEDAAGEPPTRVRMASSDTIFVLSYSIIMLNTDLHSVKVMKKMTDTEFIRNNRGIDGGKDMPAFFLRDIYEAIRDEEIRLHGDAPVEGELQSVVDDFFWEGVLRRSETIDEFSTSERLLSETPPGATEREMLQVILDCAPLPTLALCYESVPDASVALQVLTGYQDMARISAYFDQTELVNSLVRLMCQYCAKAANGGVLNARSQIALRTTQHCIMQHVLRFREAEWRSVLDVLLQLWALDLLPPHLTELDDFAGADGRPLDSLCNLRPLFPRPPDKQTADAGAASTSGHLEDALPETGSLSRQESGDGFLESLTRWFEDETRDDDEIGLDTRQGEEEPLRGEVKQYIARSGFPELFTWSGISKLPPESMQSLAKALVLLSRPSKWTSNAPGHAATGATSPGGSTSEATTAAEAGPQTEVVAAGWHDIADPVFGLELLTNMTCMPLGPGQSISQIWPLVSTHFEKLLQYVIAGGGSTEQQFIERLIVNTLRLCIRLIGNSELVPTLLTLTQHLSRLPPRLFTTYSERIACGLLVLVKETNLPHSGLCVIFALLKRISEFPGGTGACNAGIECLNYWLSDDQELSRLLTLQQFPELLATLKAFAAQNSTPASATALGHLSSLVPQLARGARNVPQVHGQWQSLWVPTLHALADIAKAGSQRSSAQAFVYLQRLLLERGSELSLPWEQVPFAVWKECLEQVLFPLLQAHPARDGGPSDDMDGSRRASAAQLICRVVLTHMPDWLRSSPDGFPVLFLRLVHILVSEAATPCASFEPLVESMKNLLLVISADPVFTEVASPNQHETLLEGIWSVVSPQFPGLRQEIAMIFDPHAADTDPTEVMAVTEDSSHPSAA